MQPARNFRELEVWQRAHNLVLKVYRVTVTFPTDERFGIISQMRRAAASVAANIAEGFKRQSQSDKIRFYNYSESSLEEVKYFLLLSRDLGYLTEMDEMMQDAEVVSKMLYKLVQKVKGRL